MDDLPERLDFSRSETRRFRVGEKEGGKRVDLFLASLLPEFSRAGLQRLMARGLVTRNGAPARPSQRLRPGDEISVDVPALLPFELEPEDLPLEILIEEETFVVVAKRPGMAVHPGRGRSSGTLANAIAHRYGKLEGAGGPHRPGIVHRLDLETSGVLVVALTEQAHAQLSAAFKARVVEKEYRALVFGEPPHDEDFIDLPLGRDVVRKTLRAVRFDPEGKAAQTEVEVLERFGSAASLRCRPRTGRTHQIRVHLQSRGHPILGDALYAAGKTPPVPVPRLMLHAHRLRFPHPETGAPVSAEAPLPEDMEAVLAALRAR